MAELADLECWGVFRMPLGDKGRWGLYKGHQQEDRGRESPACGPGIYGIVVMKLMQSEKQKGDEVILKVRVVLIDPPVYSLDFCGGI